MSDIPIKDQPVDPEPTDSSEELENDEPEIDWLGDDEDEDE